ncbi:hypothetical protein SAMN05660413_02538 [Salegentibacter flavus]|uniref:Uncharacterized protein n=1 Tax=Salegentibacter flavus TaxID=287099 RepID=A0A1I5BSR6_9FLAO|nr:hypothetical protein SAMN05660413_02538 [Salegentibacter flavus]
MSKCFLSIKYVLLSHLKFNMLTYEKKYNKIYFDGFQFFSTDFVCKRQC